MSPSRILLTVLALVIASEARAEEAQHDPGAKLLFNYVGAFNGVAAGGEKRIGAYVHTMSGGVQVAVAGPWSFTLQGAWTAGQDLSSRAIGDVAGVQGPFNTGNGLWLYEVKATYSADNTVWQFGRLSAGDALPGVAGMGQFVNSAFSSNGGAISVNDPGRATTPAATWGAWGKTAVGAVELRGGAFLSDPNRMTLAKHGLDLTFAPRNGVLGFGEVVTPLMDGLRAGVGAFGDSARRSAFEGPNVRGDEGYYLWLERPAPDRGEAVSGFAMVQAAPRVDRNLEPLMLIGGVTWQGFSKLRPADTISLGAVSGRFSHRSPLRGWETTLEANYRLTLSERLGLRPDLQYVIAPGGRGGGRDALVLGIQVEASL